MYLTAHNICEKVYNIIKIHLYISRYVLVMLLFGMEKSSQKHFKERFV